MHSLPPSLHHIIIIVESLKQKTLDEDEMNDLDSDDDPHIPGGNVIFTLDLGLLCTCLVITCFLPLLSRYSW